MSEACPNVPDIVHGLLRGLHYVLTNNLSREWAVYYSLKRQEPFNEHTVHVETILVDGF